MYWNSWHKYIIIFCCCCFLFSFWQLQDKLKPGSLLLCGFQSWLMLTEIPCIPITGRRSGLLIIIITINNYLHLHKIIIWYGLCEQAIWESACRAQFFLCLFDKDNWCLTPIFESSHRQSLPIKQNKIGSYVVKFSIGRFYFHLPVIF